jgi:Golgi phosphoprotein 3 (GPP34)
MIAKPARSLASDMFLLACDPQRPRMPRRGFFGYVLRAAALCDLRLRGVISDDEGRVTLCSVFEVDDAFLESVRRQVESARRPRWRSLIRSTAWSAYGAVREQLVEDGVIRWEVRRFVGIPRRRPVVSDWSARERLARVVDAALAPDRQVDPVDPRGTALVALAAVGRVRAAIPRSVLRANRARVDDLVAEAGPVLPALRRVIRDAQAAAGS